MNDIILDKLNEKYREGRKLESKLSKTIDKLISDLDNENMPYKDYMSIKGLFNSKSKELAELNQYNNGLHDAREIVMDEIAKNK